ncbi:LOW QUALITY PROTEIN: 5'-3' exoribonuclease 3-like [Durio zibethinus]|uniref:5'-3' exoribonuclease n=1 Tax=Durio zibethinus TaxID=66656 RepID=A0A6P5XKL6_DURZI|nr:LOW QUALITY PROTEIN: 5'-3' exoribonuclease 3-like [Durio zibethinus]
MGVPTFYRWLVNKYPKVRVKAIEEKGDDIVDTSSTNPNGIEFDNFYLDMNGIIHPCFHPEDQSLAPKTYEDVFERIYEYVDNLFSVVRPRKLLYMAIDGVAPRAKMNQQRSRRFHKAKGDEIAAAEEDRLRKQFEMEGKPVLPKVEYEVSDSNVITPGTEFMCILSEKLEGYIKSRLSNDPGWKEIQVILSDANVPGEGEHKVMSFIRYQRSIPGYNCNTSHCLYGLDADLILLTLATHEVHFSILREVNVTKLSLIYASFFPQGRWTIDVLIQEQQPGFQFASKTSSQVAESYSVKSGESFKDVKIEGAPTLKRPYEFLHVWTLREYLGLDMKMTDAPENFRFDLERIIDEFIFLCFFAGNDFLPRMPTLEIHEGAIDLLMTVYKEQFKNIGGYLVDMERVITPDLKRVEKFILLVGTYEEKIFKKRSELREHKLRRLCQYSDIDQDEEIKIEDSDLPRSMCNNSSADEYEVSCYLPTIFFLFPISNNCRHLLTLRDNKSALVPSIVIVYILVLPIPFVSLLDFAAFKNTKDLEEKLKENLRKKSDLFKNGDLDTDKVRLGVAGWKERYYEQKFSAKTKQQIEIMRKEIVQKYTEGLLWVLLYYFSGVSSWSWFYPYHHGPFASDLKGLSQVRAKFKKGHPFKPFYQLMSVLPPRSALALPKPYAKLITDADSRIIDFYPTDFEIDTDGKRYAWQGTCKLPFIDEERLIVEVRRVEKELTPEESSRNVEKSDQLFVSRNLGTKIMTLFLKASTNEKIHLDANVSGSIGGFVWLRNYDHLTSPPDILSLLFELPDGNPHIPRPLEGVKYPTKTISEGDIQKTLLWHEYPGSRPPFNRPQSQVTGTKAKTSSKFPSSSTAECQHNHISRKFSSDQIVEVHKVAGNIGWSAGRGASVCNLSVDKGISDMKISESSHNLGSYGRAQTPTNTFWPSRNASTQSLNHSWRQSSQANTNTSSQSLGKAQRDSKNDRNSAWQINPSKATVQGQGRGKFIPSNSASKWHS